MNFSNTSSATIDFDKQVPYLSFPVLEEIPFLRHGFSTKLGGVSEGIFESMNLGAEALIYKDEPEHVSENYKRISESIGIDPKSIVMSQQVHKDNILVVNQEDCGKGFDRQRDFSEIDGLVTNTPGVTLVTKYADCVPLYFVDPKHKVIGLSHSGWRGTVLQIGRKTIETMGRNFKSAPDDIIAVIGPSICSDCYEVGGDLIDEFHKAYPEHFDEIITESADGTYRCDLWRACEITMLQAGMKQENIHISGVCTSCHDDLLFSHRKTGGKRGSLAAFLAIADEQ